MMFGPAGCGRTSPTGRQAGEALVQRVHREAVGGVPDAATVRLLDEVLALPGVDPAWRAPDFATTPLPVLPIEFAQGRAGAQLLLARHDGRDAAGRHAPGAAARVALPRRRAHGAASLGRGRGVAFLPQVSAGGNAMGIRERTGVWASFLVVMLVVVAPAAARTPVPHVTGPLPVSATSYPFGAADHQLVPQDLSPARLRRGGVPRQRQGERLRAGRRPGPPSCGRRTRRTRRACWSAGPAKRARFSGNVVVEMLNPSNLFDLNIGWALSHEQFMRNGDVWVGITAKPIAVAALKTFDPQRYGALSFANPLALDDPRNCTDIQTVVDPPELRSRATEDGLVWDIYSQVGAWLRSGARVQPARLRQGRHRASRVEHAYGFGYSQTGGYLVNYINAIHPLVVAEDGRPIYDGYLVGVAGGAFVGAVPDQPVRSPRRRRPTRGARSRTSACPVIRIMSQSDYLLGIARAPARRRHAAGPLPPLRDGRRRARDAGRAVLLAAPADIVRAGRPVPPARVQRGAAQPVPELDPLRRRAAEPRPVGPRRAAAAARRADPRRERRARCSTEFGNVIGGLRSPYVDVPTSTWFGSSTGASFCFIAGHEVPFDQATLDELYPTHGAYVRAVIRNVGDLVSPAPADRARRPGADPRGGAVRHPVAQTAFSDPRRTPASRAGSRRARSTPSGVAADALSRPSDHGSTTRTSCPRAASSPSVSGAKRGSISTRPGWTRAGRTSSGSGWCGTRARRSPPAGPSRSGRATAATAATTGPAGRRPACRTRGRLAVAQDERRAERRARALAGRERVRDGPRSSQNICARVPSGKPSPGIAGELCSQPPLGVARDHVAVAVGDVEVAGVAPASARRLARADRAAPPSARRTPAGAARARPASPGRSSSDARSPTRPRRAAVRSPSSSAPRSHRRVLRVAVPGLAVGERELRALHDRVHELGAVAAHRRAGRTRPAARAAAAAPAPAPTARSCRSCGPRSRMRAGGSTVAANAARSSPVISPAWRRPVRSSTGRRRCASIASATKPRRNTSRARSIWPSRSAVARLGLRADPAQVAASARLLNRRRPRAGGAAAGQPQLGRRGPLRARTAAPRRAIAAASPRRDGEAALGVVRSRTQRRRPARSVP